MESNKKSNSWLSHVKQFREQNPNVSYKQCLSDCKETYKKNDQGKYKPVNEVIPLKKVKKSKKIVEAPVEEEDEPSEQGPFIKTKIKRQKKLYFQSEE